MTHFFLPPRSATFSICCVLFSIKDNTTDPNSLEKDRLDDGCVRKKSRGYCLGKQQGYNSSVVGIPFGNSGSCTGIKWCPGAKIMLNLSDMGKLHIDQPKSVISGRAVSGREMPRSTFSSDVVDRGSLSPQRMDLWELPLIIFSHLFFFFCQPWKNNWFPEDKGSRKQEQRRSSSRLKPSSDPVSSGSERIWNRNLLKAGHSGLKTWSVGRKSVWCWSDWLKRSA